MSDRRKARHEAVRAEILTTAWDLARERGLTGWSLREVAAGMGMRAPSLYVYFSSKEAIYDAMFAQGYDELIGRIEAEELPEAADEVLWRTATVFFEFCLEDPARFQLLFLRVVPGFVPSPEAYARAQAVLNSGREVLSGVGVDDEGSVDLWTAMLTGMVSQQISNDPGGDRWKRLIGRAVDMFLASELPAAAR